MVFQCMFFKEVLLWLLNQEGCRSQCMSDHDAQVIMQLVASKSTRIMMHAFEGS